MQSSTKSSRFQELFDGTFGPLRRSRPIRGAGSPRSAAWLPIDPRQDGVGMSRSQLVAEHLPLLRRYARALTGNQASGDAYVAAMLEALLQDPALLEERYGPRAGLFRLFTKIWNSVSINDKSEV